MFFISAWSTALGHKWIISQNVVCGALSQLQHETSMFNNTVLCLGGGRLAAASVRKGLMIILTERSVQCYVFLVRSVIFVLLAAELTHIITGFYGSKEKQK